MRVQQLLEEFVPSLEDTAMEFIETEVGRHDWQANWKQLKASHDMVEHVRAWLSNLQLQHLDPHKLVEWIDLYVELEKGPWIG